MVVNLDELQKLVETVSGFQIRDRTMLREQEEMRKSLMLLLKEGKSLSNGHVARYQTAVKRYFAKFQNETAGHLRDIDKRLEHLAQVQANAVAERSVAARRHQLTQDVLATIERV